MPPQSPTADDYCRIFGRLTFDFAHRIETLEKEVRLLHEGFQMQLENLRSRLADLQGENDVLRRGGEHRDGGRALPAMTGGQPQ